MKIITNDAVYVQKNDLAFLNTTDLPIPACVFIKFFGVGSTIIDINRYEFVKFTDIEAIEYFKKLDWIIDYNEVKELNEEETKEVALSINEKYEKIALTFNSLNEEEQKENMNMVRQAQFLEFKFYSLRDILWFKQGHIKMELPEEHTKKLK